MRSEAHIQKRVVAVYLATMLGSGCGFLVQTLVSGFWTSAFSEDVYFYSLNLAFYFLCMGIGGMLSRLVKHPTVSHLAALASLLAIWSALSIPLLKLLISTKGGNPAFPVCFVSFAALLAGLLVPLALRVPEVEGKINLARLFFVDYCAAICFTLVFLFIFLVPFGYIRTGIFIAYFSLAVVGVLGVLVSGIQPRGAVLWLLSVGVASLAWWKPQIQQVTSHEGRGEAKVIFEKQSHYQKIVLTEEVPNDPILAGMKEYALYLDGFNQFSTLYEQLYHACLFNVPMSAVEHHGGSVKRALILGGGDALGARNLLQSKGVESVTLVELDPEIISLSKNHPILKALNLNAYSDPRLHVVVGDAFQWVRSNQEKFDLILLDFPAPKNLTLARLFSAEFYSQVFRALTPKGMAAIQAGPSYSHNDPDGMTLSNVAGSVAKTVEAVGFTSHVYTAAAGNEAFVLVHRPSDFDMVGFSTRIGMNSDTATAGHSGEKLCSYNRNWIRPDVRVNTINFLPLAGYMIDWFRDRGGQFFYYRGHQVIFLRD